jgi:putative flavoprotein involved in K+ transport
MDSQQHTELDTVIVGGGQAGIALGYWLAQEGREFAILDGNTRPGDAWRQRWDSLRLFTPAK